MLVFLFLKWKSSTLQCKITSKHNTALKRDKALSTIEVVCIVANVQSAVWYPAL
jgi:uncharacterized membrane protein